jgi:hypothetical protein
MSAMGRLRGTVLLLALLAALGFSAAAAGQGETASHPPPAGADQGAAGGAESDAPEAESPPAVEPGDGHGNTLRWSTASEVDNFGFDVYRGEAADGPFVRLTAEPIPGAGTSDLPSHYLWVDDTIAPDRDYYYYVESISMAGVRERFTPVLQAPRKVPTDGEDEGKGDDESAGKDGDQGQEKGEARGGGEASAPPPAGV